MVSQPNNIRPDHSELLLFAEQMPAECADDTRIFKSECPPDKKFKVQDLFEFRRGRGDYHASIAAALVALFFLLFFWSETGWQNRKLPDNIGQYVGYQFGLTEIDGRKARLGTILKQSWVAPVLCLALLVPATLWNLRASLKVRRWRQRFLLPVESGYETSKYIAALEFVAYFILYTMCIPVLGYLLSTLIMGVFLTWRLGYRTFKWLLKGLVSSFAIVVIFRTLLQIKTPSVVWLYDQLPSALRVFMLTYF